MLYWALMFLVIALVASLSDLAAKQEVEFLSHQRRGTL